MTYPAIPAPARKLLAFIGHTEAPQGYETIYGNNQSKLPKPLTSMTFDEVVTAGPAWTKAYGSSAAGHYQFMRNTLDAPRTLEDIKGEMRLTGSERFDAALQDAMGFHLLKRRGYDKFMAGRLSVTAFGLNLAKEWASFPVLRACKGQHRRVERGQSYYAGDGQNHALVTPEAVEALLEEIRPAGAAAQAEAVPAGPVAPVEAPQLVQPAGPPAAGFLGRLRSLFGRAQPAAAAVPVASPTKGDPTVYRVQERLRQINYYRVGRLDGVDSIEFRDAVAAARKDNGLGDGGLDAAFLTGLYSFGQRPVSKSRGEMGYREAARYRPEVVKPSVTVGATGLAGLFASVVGGSGALDKLGATVDRANGYLDKADAWATKGASVAAFLGDHWPWVVGGICAWLVWKGIVGVADGIHKIRQAVF